MTQADFTIANQTFPNTRTELNTSLQALATNSAGDSAPSTTFANQWWFDSDGNKLYMRNKDNDAWVSILTIGATSDLQTVTTDIISEVTSAAGVTIDSLLIKDGKITNLMNATLSAADLGAGVHIKTADSGASAHASADELVIEGSANSGINILSGNSSEGGIYFGDDGDNDIGRIRYDHTNNSLDFFTNASEACHIDANGNFKRQAAGAVSIGVGSTDAGGAFLLLDGDSNGDFSGSDYSYIAHDSAGRLEIFQDSPSGTNQIRFYTAAVERMRLDAEGDLAIGATSSTSRLLLTQPNNNTSFGNLVTNASYSNHVNYWQTGIAGSTSFNFLIAISNTDSSNDTEFRIQGTGATQSDGAYSGSGVDFGEYFEWADGNSSDEVRYGYSVVLDENKIRKATAEDNTTDIIGIISAHPTIIGDGDIDKWNQKYLRDDFNKSIREEYTVTTWKETVYNDNGSAQQAENVNYPTDAIPSDVTVPSEDVTDSEGRVIKTKAVVVSTHDDGTKLTRKKLNPDWDSSLTYIPREERKEWDVVGLVGKLRMHKGQPTNPNWRKMRDISDSVEEWLVR